ncbi:MAG: hypothetical protein FD126_3055, partial [Elusimicrobia bacterium]
MGPTRLAAAVLTAALLVSSAQAQGEAEESQKVKKILEKTALKEKLLLECKKGGDCKPELLEKKKKKSKKPKAGGGFSEAESDDEAEPAPDDAQAPPAGEQAEALRREAVGRRERAM